MGVPVQKTSDIIFWTALEIRRGILYTPISKLDADSNNFIVPAQLLAAYEDRTRILLRKAPSGSIETIPYGGIIMR